LKTEEYSVYKKVAENRMPLKHIGL